MNDPDNTDAQITWTLTGNTNLTAAINPNTRIATIVAKNGAWNGSETVTFRASDPEGLYDSYGVVFTIIAGNNPPVVENQDFMINVQGMNGMYIGTVIAYDPDPDQILSYSIIGGNEPGIFMLNKSTGDLNLTGGTSTNQLSSEYTLTVMVEDNGVETESSTATIKISVIQGQDTYYIDPSSTDDQNSNGTREHPFRSWKSVPWRNHAIYLQRKGTIARESKISIGADYITMGSYGEGERPVIISSASDYAVRAFERNNLVIRDLNIVAEDAISCIYILGATEECTIENCRLEGAENGVRIIESKKLTLYYNTFIRCSDAIYSFAENNKVYYNIFKNNQVGINISSYLASADVFNNVFFGNSTGISVSYSLLTLYNNIFYLEKAGDKALNANTDNLVSDNNIYYPEKEGFISVANANYNSLHAFQETRRLDMNSFNLDPRFSDSYNENYSVEPSSPAIDAGKTVGLNQDFYGKMVPCGDKPDIGLCESQTGAMISGIKTESAGDMGNSGIPTVYPNPSNGAFNIYFKENIGQKTKVIITDLAGKIIAEENEPPAVSDLMIHLDLTYLIRGIYVLTVVTDGKIFNQRLVIK